MSKNREQEYRSWFFGWYERTYCRTADLTDPKMAALFEAFKAGVHAEQDSWIENNESLNRGLEQAKARQFSKNPPDIDKPLC